MILFRSFILLAILLCSEIQSTKAFEAASPFWLPLKGKLKAYLDKTIDKNTYSYSIVGPAKEMTSFLGNRPDLTVKFSGLNLQSPGHRKTVIATAFDESGNKLDSLALAVDVLVFDEVYMLKTSISKGQEIRSDNVYSKRIPIKAADAPTYYRGTISQKVAGISIPAGTPIRATMLRHEKLVQIGDMIKIKSGNQTITLEFMCKAMSSGDLGDTITINCPDMQNKSKKAKVTSEESAELI